MMRFINLMMQYFQVSSVGGVVAEPLTVQISQKGDSGNIGPVGQTGAVDGKIRSTLCPVAFSSFFHTCCSEFQKMTEEKVGFKENFRRHLISVEML